MRVKKSVKKQGQPGADVIALVDKFATTSELDLAAHLSAFQVWLYPRGDLHAWIPALDRFDAILEDICSSYELSRLQTNDFTPRTRHLLLEILRVIRLLLEHCTSRKLFSSYDRLHDLLHSNDVSVIQASVLILLRLSQQYGTGTPLENASQIPKKMLVLARGGDTDIKTLTSSQSTDKQSHVEVQFYPPGSSTSISVNVPSLEALPTIAEEKHMPLEDQLIATNKLRLASAQDISTRRQLVSLRLNSLAAYLYLTGEDHTIFLYEPDLISQMAQVLLVDDDSVVAAALNALEACANLRAKTSDVLLAVSANAGHGPLITLYRSMISRERSYTLLDSFYTFISFIANSPTHSHILTGAGMIPLLLEMLQTNWARRENYIPRTTGLLETIFFSTQQALPLFSAADGVNILVNRIKAEMRTYLDSTPPPSSETLSSDSITFYRTSPLKALLRTIQRLLQSSGGFEGLRNLVDSDVPKALKTIFESSDQFGAKVYSIAINLMATFVHNEPTSLAILQELQLPQSLYAELEKGVPSSHEVVCSVPNAVGAICLNQAGLDYTIAHSRIITNLITTSVLVTPEAGVDRDSAHHFGFALDELVRHHPSLRTFVLDAIMDLLRQAPSKSDPLSAYMHIFKTLEGLLRNSAFCKDFVAGGGLNLIFAFTDLPCAPPKFMGSDIALSMARILRAVGEHEHVQLVDTFIESVNVSMSRLPSLLDDDWSAVEEQQLDDLQGVTNRCSLFAEISVGLSWSHSRTSTTLVKSVMSADGFIVRLGRLHRSAFTVHVLLNRQSVTTGGSDEDNQPESKAKIMATRSHAVMTKLFKAMIKSLSGKRNTDDAHQREARTMADAISECMLGHLRASISHPAKSAELDTIAVGLVTMLLFDERGHEGHLNTVLFVSFVKLGGMTELMSACNRLIDSMDDQPDNEASRVRATGGLQIAALALCALASPKALLDSPQTATLLQRAQSGDKFQPLDLFIQSRYAILPLAHRMWSADWLPQCPPTIVKKIVRAYLSIMEGEREQVNDTLPPAPTATRAAVTVANPVRVDQLVDMGFDRAAAEFALLRTHNNIALATDALLNMPHLFATGPPIQTPELGPTSPPQPDAPATSEDEMESAVVEMRAPRQELDEMRSNYRLELFDRALALLDHSENLVFDLLPAIKNQTMEQILNAIAQATAEHNERSISARSRLAAILLREADTIDAKTFGHLFGVVQALPLDSLPRPQWIPAVLLLSESALELCQEVYDVKLGEDNDVVVRFMPDVAGAMAQLVSLAEQICRGDSTREEFISAMRFLVSSRSTHVDVEGLVQPFKVLSSKTQGCHSYLAIAVRHTFEDQQTLQQVMAKEIRHFLNPGHALHGKISDISHFVRKLSPVAHRDPATFVSVVEQNCELLDASPPQSVYHIRAKAGVVKPTADDPFVGPEHSNPVMDFLVSELSTVRQGMLRTDQQDRKSRTYPALILSLITEIVGSYTNAKFAFVASVRRPNLLDGARSGIGAIINELVCNVDLRADICQPDRSSTNPLLMSKWSASLVVALCSSVAPGDGKDSPEDLTSVRKMVLDAIAKAIKDTSAEDLALRYGKLWALGELVWRLLSSRSRNVRHDETTLHIAKIMLEKNFVGLLTHAAGEIDLNYPEVGTVLASLLRALEQLSKISVKWSKSDKSKPLAPPSESEQEDSDVEMSEDEQANFYRNSSLGIFDPDLGEDDEDDQDDEDEMMEGFDEMDHDSEEDSNTEPSSEEDAEMGDGEWTDEDEDEDDAEEVEDEDAEIALEPIHDDDGWEDDHLDPESSGTDVDDGELNDEDEEDEGMDDEEVDVDEIDIVDSMPNMDDGGSGFADMWGWQSSHNQRGRNDQRRRSTLLDTDEPMTAMFGDPRHGEIEPAPHPLIAQSVPSPPTAVRRMGRAGFHELLEALEGRGVLPSTQLIENLLGRAHRHHVDSVRIDISTDNGGSIGLSIPGPAGLDAPSTSNEGVEVSPESTVRRWDQEMAMRPHVDPQARLVAHIVNRLLPEARKRADDESRRQQEAEAETVAVAPSEHNEEPKPASAALVSESPQIQEGPDVEMGRSSPRSQSHTECIDETGDQPEQSADVTLARTIVRIHGADVDITDTGIDVEFLQALPDEMRADVVEQHMREQERHRRPAATDAPPAGSQLNSEFLDALPPDIRAEVIMQEALETARRAHARPLSPPANLAPTGNPTGFLASLDEELRDVMMTGPGGGLLDIIAGGKTGHPVKKAPLRESIQLLDRSGIASLVRLLFYPEAFRKGHLFKVLGNLCDNSVTRAELLGLLLAVVQDGSADIPAVDRSFQQMSLRALSTPKSTPKGKATDTKQYEPSTPIGNVFNQLATDHVPTFIAQRCFEALSFIVTNNSRAVEFFLTEHEQSAGLKKSTSKKGKGKEKVLPQTKFPIILLLSLLDRPLILKTPGMLESLTSLLAVITKPILSAPKNQADNGSIAVDVEVPPQTSASVNIGPNSSPSAVTLLRTIPDPVLRLTANCLTAGECNSRTFGHTLAVMQNLSRLADARDVILQEIRTRAQSIGLVIKDELGALRDALQKTEDVMNSDALAAFLPASASQAQLLRLLKTIDYLYTDKTTSDIERKTDEAVREIYQSFDFDALWAQLGECLGMVSEGGRTDQIAITLLPLIESLMVVCKYRVSAGREVRSPSIPPNTQTDSADLFVTFTSAHRKILNTIVRNNPALLGGSFSLLVQNPRMLEFDNKRNWFFQKLKRRKDQVVSSGVIHLNVRRQYVFEDSYRALGPRSGDEVKYGKLSVKFSSEEGVDAGGVTREWYSVLAQQIFDPNFALFEPCAADQQTYQPNKASAVNGDHHLGYFKFVGRVIGKAVYDGRLLDAYFSRAFYKQILGRNVDMRDLESIDPEYHKSLQWMLDNDITGVIDQEFTIEDDQFGEKKIVELKPGGADIAVTEENKEEYVRLVVSYRLDNSIKDQIKAFLNGFYEIIPRSLVQIFEPDQLELLISGITTVDVDELKNATQLSGWKPSDPEVAWFWRALRSFSQEERSRFLMFVTSSSRVPLGGFTQLQGSSGTQPFQIQKLYAAEGSLPQASTCFNLLLLPKYASYEQLRERLQFAVTETGGFGKA
ncbi:hypothetical protein BCR39DRAFT_491673 [Naematelia encephala]|uniref:HECT-type E3 ubiquitin transferase n=1 Tax=Naematelia encephala TaxID=71784 RepID=A0A1Y2BEW8_9TREE|nr:hypothetical protein BCR39DRAFT_491673 [Naematelia encephala]